MISYSAALYNHKLTNAQVRQLPLSMQVYIICDTGTISLEWPTNIQTAVGLSDQRYHFSVLLVFHKSIVFGLQDISCNNMLVNENILLPFTFWLRSTNRFPSNPTTFFIISTMTSFNLLFNHKKCADMLSDRHFCRFMLPFISKHSNANHTN